MSNANIAARLVDLADRYEKGIISTATFANDLVGHAEALEALDYRHIKEAHQVRGQLEHAVEVGREHDIDREALITWLRAWISRIPMRSA